jgi:carbonic anhydrase/acetyltransferase-like protein (isoleucine patch superfamily)
MQVQTMQGDARFMGFVGVWPTVGADVFVADTARVIGKVTLEAGVSVWFGSVIRGDVFDIHIGARTNIQDCSVVHVTSGRHATWVGEDVTVGHRVTLHGCKVGARALIGMGSIVLDGAEVGEEAMVGAGALVTPRTVIPPRMLALGSPAKVVRELTESELAMVRRSAPHYFELAKIYREAGGGQ